MDAMFTCSIMLDMAGVSAAVRGTRRRPNSATGSWERRNGVLFSTFLAFKPSSESLKLDAAIVARHIVNVIGVDELIIHGESIGGMAAAGAAKALTATSSSQHPNVSTILVCDRTFCNLEAVAQRLVGRWDWECHTPPDAGVEHRLGTRLLSGEMSQDRSARQRRRDYSRLFISEIWTGVRGGVDQRPDEENRMDHVPADGIPDCGFRQR